MRMQNSSINSVVFQKEVKSSEKRQGQHEGLDSRCETFNGFGIGRGTFLWCLVLMAVIYGLIVASSNKANASDLPAHYLQYSILPPPSPRGEIAIKDVFFDFNKFHIKESAKAVLRENAEILRSNPDVIVFIQGHCDSRENTDEYLGLKRANAVKDYIVKQGVEPQRVNSVDKCSRSYVSSTTYESPWRLDRMVHFIPFSIKQKTLDIALN